MVHLTAVTLYTDVVKKVNFLVAASQHGGTSVAEGSPWAIAHGQKWLCFGHFSQGDHCGSFPVNFLKNEILRFDENLAVVLFKSDLQPGLGSITKARLRLQCP